jgi:pimeloyl-ACP methyl ester carboxylesterase
MAIAGAAPAARAQIAYAPCGDTNQFACGHLTVALDPTGTVPGTLTLAMRRHRAPVGEARSAIIALAGGPGQPALPFAEQFDELLGPVAATRDLIALDQRGVGLSHPLSCHAFERPNRFRAIGPLVETCAAQLGPTRSLYTSADTVADIEALRQAGGYEKLVLYGTSYGTKVAELYAQAHPDRVEALVLDSVVPPNGPDGLARSTFAAVPSILRGLCAARACAGVTTNPVGDLAAVVSATRRGPLNGRAIDGNGRAHVVKVSSDLILALLLAGDFSQALRAELVSAVSAQRTNHDSAPLARLVGLGSSASGEEQQDFDTPLYFATTCEEEAFPWNRAATPSVRMAEARAAAAALPARVFAPFTRANALDLGDEPACAGWPYATAAPPPDTAPLPAVPTLILSGAQDLRTPTADARALAAQIPGSNLLVVPYTGHSVLGGEPTSCARDALIALFAHRPVRACSTEPPPTLVRPAPLPPPRLGLVSPIHAYPGRDGRTLHAVALSLSDLARQVILQLGSVSSESLAALVDLRTGGLRAGWAEFAGGVLTLHGYAYVPGVTVSGTLGSNTANLRVGGSAAAPGTLRLGAHGALVGTLGGRRVKLAANSIASAAIVGANAEASSPSGPGNAARRRLAGELAAVLEGIVRP